MANVVKPLFFLVIISQNHDTLISEVLTLRDTLVSRLVIDCNLHVGSNYDITFLTVYY